MSKTLKSSILACILLLVLALSARATYVPYSPQNFNDELFWLYDNGDATKKLQFELDAITTGNTRTIIIGDADGDTADWNTAYGWGDHGSGGYLKADGSVTVTGAMTHNVGADTNYIELNPGAGNYAIIDSNGELGIHATNVIELTAGAGADMHFDAGGYYRWTDTDASYALRMALNSATGDLTVIGAIDIDSGTIDGVTIGTNSACTALQVDNININGDGIFDSSGILILSAPGRSISMPQSLAVVGDIGATDDVSCDELTLTNGQDYKFSRRATDYLTFEGQDTVSPIGFEMVPKSTGGADFVAITLWHDHDTFPDITPSEYAQLNFDNSPEEFVILTSSVDTGTVWPIMFRAGGNTNQVRLEADGDVIMATLPTFASGTALQIDAGDRLGTLSSSIRYKKNIEDITNSNEIYSLRPVCYDANDGSEATGLYGLIAEEVDLVMPELVRYKRERIMGEEPSTVDPNIMEPYIKGYRQTDIPEGVHTDRLIPLMLKEIQLLKARVDAQELRIAVLEAEVEKLEGP